MVCLFHMSGLGAISPPGFLHAFLKHGAIGVPIFFVITGFVIPYSLHVGKYEVRQFFVFLSKRLIRLEPPYLVSIVAAILFFLVFGFHIGPPLNLSMESVLLHFGYLVGMASFLGTPADWYIPAFWTLQFEFQFYVVAALAFPLASSRQLLSRLLFVAAFLALQASLPPDESGTGIPLLFRISDLFLLGVVIFQKKIGLIGTREFLPLSMLLIASIGARYESFFFYGPAIAVLILLVNAKSRITGFMGNISYSLYLYHSLFGLWLIGALVTVARLDHVSAFVVAVPCTIFFSWVMYVLVERPSVRAAKKIAYARTNPPCASPT